MVYASSKDALRKQLVGIAAEIQATSYDEITYEAGKWNMNGGTSLTMKLNEHVFQSSTSAPVVKYQTT